MPVESKGRSGDRISYSALFDDLLSQTLCPHTAQVPLDFTATLDFDCDSSPISHLDKLARREAKPTAHSFARVGDAHADAHATTIPTNLALTCLSLCDLA